MKRIASHCMGQFTKRRRILFAMLAAYCLLTACLVLGCSSNSSSSASSESSSSSASESLASSEAVKDIAKPEPKATGVRYVFVIGNDKWEKWPTHASLMCLLRIDLDNQDVIRQFVDRQMPTTLMGYAYRDGVDGAVSVVQNLQGLVQTNIPADEQAAWIKALGSNGSFRVVGTTGPFVGGFDDAADGLWL